MHLSLSDNSKIIISTYRKDKLSRHNRGAFRSNGLWGDRSMKSAGLCNVLTAVEVGKAYDETLGGDGCWQEEVCHSRRSYYQKGRGSRVRRSLHVEEIVVPIPEIPFVVYTRK